MAFILIRTTVIYEASNSSRTTVFNETTETFEKLSIPSRERNCWVWIVLPYIALIMICIPVIVFCLQSKGMILRNLFFLSVFTFTYKYFVKYRCNITVLTPYIVFKHWIITH